MNIADFFHDLKPRIAGELRTDDYSRMLYSTDASLYQVMPYGVMIPAHEDDLQAAVETAAKYKVPVLPRASGSSLAGQAVNEALVMDTTRHLDRVLEVNPEEQWVRVQPGIVLDELNAALKPVGLQFGPDPASSNRAALGGIVSTNATGSHSILHGMTADHVLEMRVILSDGSTAHFVPLTPEQWTQSEQKGGLEGRLYREIHTLAETHADTIRAYTPRHWRRCGGYNLDRMIPEGGSFLQPQDSRLNLAKLITGAEGTLAVITELKLNLVPVPRMTALAIIHFQELHTALSAVPAILETEPSAIELLDHLGLTLCRDVPEYARLLKTFADGDPYCVLVTEYYGESETELKAKIDRLKRQKIGASAVVPVMTPQGQNDVWTVRKVGLGLLMSLKGDHKPIPFIEDAAVPVEHLPDYISQLEAFCGERGTKISYYGHASAGCLHVRPVINTKAAQEIAKLPEIARFSVELLRGYGGALSSEHGDGRTRSWLNEAFFGPELYALYQETKRIFDPDNLLNPGMVVNAPPMTQHLRYGENYRAAPIKLHLDFRHEQGFDRAVEMCNGAAVCRKKTSGTMCPSFMVTREEEHSTRGRANALRAAMTGVLPIKELTSPRMYEVMDLCIECKACKAECPSSVDMAKLKFEFLAQYYAAHGTPLRARLFGHIATLSRLSSGFLAPLVNWAARQSLVRRGLERFLGISRPLPPFARVPFTTWFKRRDRPHNDKARGKVVLFNDTFNTYNDPHVAIAAVEVLEAAGFEVVLPGHYCCGRPMISKGMVEGARRAAQDTVRKLAPFARQGIPIVGLEPSCLLTLRDEYLYVLPGDPDARCVAEQAYTFEEFFARFADEIGLNFTEEKRHLLLHGHCHQKALVGTAPSKRVLTLPPNYTVQEVDSGCCGMAGSFGYEAEHLSISLQMGERRLLPAVRQADEETLIVAAGVSCRQQIQYGTGKTAFHPAEVLRKALDFIQE
ncbi:MAG: FAD-binding protein [Anaerolineae bacterium]|nr:FAD-binding protein [Anaerolineae bacterium]